MVFVHGYQRAVQDQKIYLYHAPASISLRCCRNDTNEHREDKSKGDKMFYGHKLSGKWLSSIRSLTNFPSQSPSSVLWQRC